MIFLSEYLNFVLSLQLNLQAQLQQRMQLESQKADVTSSNQAYEREIKDSKHQVEPLRSSLVEANERKQEVEMCRETLREDVRQKLDAIKNSGNKVRDVNNEVNR